MEFISVEICRQCFQYRIPAARHSATSESEEREESTPLPRDAPDDLAARVGTPCPAAISSSGSNGLVSQSDDDASTTSSQFECDRSERSASAAKEPTSPNVKDSPREPPEGCAGSGAESGKQRKKVKTSSFAPGNEHAFRQLCRPFYRTSEEACVIDLTLSDSEDEDALFDLT
jgi:hypothetical protein